MKVLSDKTAKRLLRLLDESGSGARQRRGASAFTPPASLWQLHVREGVAAIDRGFWLAGGVWRECPAQEIGEASARKLVVAKPSGGNLAITLEDPGELPDPPFRVIGRIAGEDGNLHVEQYESGPLAFDAHWGATDPVTEIPANGEGSWRAVVEGSREEASAVAESRLVDIDVDSDGKVTGMHYRTQTIDANGNVVAISERTKNPEPDPEEGEDGGDTPPCGHPLNSDDDYHPLGNGGGGGDDDNDDDTHPLEEEGDGGFTPLCGKE